MIELSKNQILQGDSAQLLKSFPDNSIDLVVTDPPYGYSFMGKDWDKAVPSVDVWKECLRVLKPGAFAFVMSAPRQDVLSQMIVRLSEAGFDTSFTSIYWTYASGFPKAANVGKLVDKRLGAEREVTGKAKGHVDSGGNYDDDNYEWKPEYDRKDKPATPQAKALEGSYAGFQPKPAVEVIIVCMKPLSEKTYVEQALTNQKGITWLDDCRIPYDGESDNQGRFPANLLVSDDVLNDGRITKSNGHAPKVDNSQRRTYGNYAGIVREQDTHFNDVGSYSRYFDLDKWAEKTLPFLIVPKASTSEKNEGLEDNESEQVNDGRAIPPNNAFQRGQTLRKNTHPTVKPLQLMSYLITMGSRPKDIVLDPFCGSGTTCIAAKELGRDYIGIELDPTYAEDARARVKAGLISLLSFI